MKKALVAAFVALVATSYIVCKAGDVFSDFGGAVEGNGNVIKKEITGLGNFDKVGNGISANMILTQGSEYKVVYEGESNLLDLIKFEVEGSSLNVENKKNSWNSWTTSKRGITIYITMPTLKAVALGGSGDISSTNDFDSDNLDIAIGGSGNIQLSGQANKIDIAIGGSGDVDLRKLKAKRGEIAIGGSGNCEVQVSDELEVAIAGSGDVKCKGRPRLKESVSGSGEVELMD